MSSVSNQPAVGASEPAEAFLEIREAGAADRTAPLDAAGTVLGRADEAAVRLPCESVSRRHAEIKRDERGRWWLRDLNSVNGTWAGGHSISETVLNGGDEFVIGKYQFRLVTPGIEAPTRSTTTIADLDPLPLGDLRDARISTFSEVAAPKIDTTHLATINAFAREISHTEETVDRLGALCRLMVHDAFHGQSAVALRIARADGAHGPALLCAPEIRAGAAEPYLSQSLLKVVRETGSAAVATQGAESAVAIKMTIVATPEEIAAVACPIGGDAETLDVLYVTLPAAFGTGEWLTLISHASQTYEQIETALAAQRELEAKAALERELDKAWKIQQALIPTRPDVEGLEVAIGFEPCRWVAGDYVDVMPSPDGRVMLAVADVCGKGLPAAMVSSTLHSMVRTCRETGIELRPMVRALNDHLCKFLGDSSFVTMVCLILDPRTGAFEVVNAGHPAPVVVDPDGRIGLLQQGCNYPLGVIPESDFDGQEGVIEPGQLVGLFTDGLTELHDEHEEQLGPDRIAEQIRDLYVGGEPGTLHSAEQVASGLTDVLDRLLGDRTPLDDRTFLLVRRPPTG